jgi:hypothetical protein
MPILKIDALMDARRIPIHDGKLFDPGVGTTLYDISVDPKQLKPFRDPAIERRMLQGIAEQMRLHDAPAELYARYGIVPKRAASAAGKIDEGGNDETHECDRHCRRLRLGAGRGSTGRGPSALRRRRQAG